MDSKHRLQIRMGDFGLGIRLLRSPNGIEVASVDRRGPAYRSGHVHEGDFILSVDGISMTSKSVEQVRGIAKESSRPWQYCFPFFSSAEISTFARF